MVSTTIIGVAIAVAAVASLLAFHPIVLEADLLRPGVARDEAGRGRLLRWDSAPSSQVTTLGVTDASCHVVHGFSAPSKSVAADRTAPVSGGNSFAAVGFEDVVAVAPHVAIGCASNLFSLFNAPITQADEAAGVLDAPGKAKVTECITLRMRPTPSTEDDLLSITSLPVDMGSGIPNDQIFFGRPAVDAAVSNEQAASATTPIYPALFVHGIHVSGPFAHDGCSRHRPGESLRTVIAINHAFTGGGERLEVFDLLPQTFYDSPPSVVSRPRERADHCREAVEPSGAVWEQPLVLRRRYSLVSPVLDVDAYGTLNDVAALDNGRDVYVTQMWHEATVDRRGPQFDGGMKQSFPVLFQVARVLLRFTGSKIIHCRYNEDHLIREDTPLSDKRWSWPGQSAAENTARRHRLFDSNVIPSVCRVVADTFAMANGITVLPSAQVCVDGRPFTLAPTLVVVDMLRHGVHLYSLERHLLIDDDDNHREHEIDKPSAQGSANATSRSTLDHIAFVPLFRSLDNVVLDWYAESNRPHLRQQHVRASSSAPHAVASLLTCNASSASEATFSLLSGALYKVGDDIDAMQSSASQVDLSFTATNSQAGASIGWSVRAMQSDLAFDSADGAMSTIASATILRRVRQSDDVAAKVDDNPRGLLVAGSWKKHGLLVCHHPHE